MSAIATRCEGSTRSALGSLAPLFRYPDRSYDAALISARRFAGDADQEAVAALDRFARELAPLPDSERQVAYTSTFDLAPFCSPYIGEHLFGAESGDRACLMIGLRSSYLRAGASDGPELPDHLAEVLQFASTFEEDEWQSLRRLLLLPALSMMDDILAPSANPFRHLIAAARHLAAAGSPGEEQR